MGRGSHLRAEPSASPDPDRERERDRRGLRRTRACRGAGGREGVAGLAPRQQVARTGLSPEKTDPRLAARAIVAEYIRHGTQ